MSQSEKKRRKAFLNDLCREFGIDESTDPKRSDAAMAFIAYGETQCRGWLAQAAGNYAAWVRLVDIKRARRLASKHRKAKKKTQRTFLHLSTSKRRKKRSCGSQVTVRDFASRGRVCADGSGTGWRNLSRSEESSLANRI